jgi:mono/diheme cytochrome c family protein
VLLVATVGGAAVAGGAQTRSVTPVSGPSRLHQLGLTIEQSAMGSAGSWGPLPQLPARPANDLKTSSALDGPAAVTGADLYRLDCRACHEADGRGVPPDINSLIPPVQGTSLILWEQRMKQAGRSIDPSFAREVVNGARTDLLRRLRDGGEKMPPFAYLRQDEVQALVSYLDRLADVPGAGNGSRPVAESPLRLGELLVKGTCHICHDATGSWPTPAALLDGAIPPLATLTTHLTVDQVIQKVRNGAPVVIGTAQVPSPGRMPIFRYLTDQEVAAAYLYLVQHPPE